ncbi:MAG TPA: alpha/beta hydrolase [Polyangiaceae bacterium]|nr:alpha/beta hydrolase [Polyangiaceae bacterium]
MTRSTLAILAALAAAAGACSSQANGDVEPTTPTSAGANSAGTSSFGAGPSTASAGNPGTGGSSDSAAGSSTVTGGNAGTNASQGGADSGAGGNAGSNSTAGTGGGGAPQTYPTDPPMPDRASKVPVSKPSGAYTVEANFAYGPETSQRLDVIYPSNAGPKGTQRLPVVLMFHGGAWIHSYTNGYGSGKDHMSTFFNRYLAHGFMVCNAEYRVNDSPPVDGAPAPAAVEDALLAAKWCWDYLDYFHGDRERFVVTGASAGGHLALMVGLTTPAAKLGPTSPIDFKIAAVVSGYGPADIESEINAVAKDWIPSSLPNRTGIAKLVNPITYVRADVPPFIVVQGAKDNTAPVKDSQHLVDLLEVAGAEASIHLVPNAGHGFDDSTWPDAEQAMFDWLTARGIGK